MQRTMISAALAATLLSGPATAQPAGPSITLTVPCAPVEGAMSALKQHGYRPVARGTDVDGDPFALFRAPSGEWRAVVMTPMPDGSLWACSLLGGAGLVVDAAGEGV